MISLSRLGRLGWWNQPCHADGSITARRAPCVVVGTPMGRNDGKEGETKKQWEAGSAVVVVVEAFVLARESRGEAKRGKKGKKGKKRRGGGWVDGKGWFLVPLYS